MRQAVVFSTLAGDGGQESHTGTADAVAAGGAVRGHQGSERMKAKKMLAGLAGLMLLLGACAYSGDSGEQAVQPEPTPPTDNPLHLGTGTFEPAGVTPGAPTGTAVGQRVEQLRAELTRLQGMVSEQNGRLQGIRGQTIQNAQTYHNLVGLINTKLQIGTTPGNPILVEQWNQAQSQLELVNNDLGQMTALSNDVAQSASLSAYLLETARATYGISGAVDEDHRQLQILEDETSQTVVLIDRLQTELTQDIVRQTNYLGAERSNLQVLALAVSSGEPYGTSLANRTYTVPMQFAAPGSGIATGRPLVVIRFDSERVDYEPALFSAVSAALDRRPNAAFDVVAVSPAVGSQAQMAINASEAQRHADAVLRSLASMGLPAERVSVTSVTSPGAQVNEVHVFVR